MRELRGPYTFYSSRPGHVVIDQDGSTCMTIVPLDQTIVVKKDDVHIEMVGESDVTLHATAIYFNKEDVVVYISDESGESARKGYLQGNPYNLPAPMLDDAPSDSNLEIDLVLD